MPSAGVRVRAGERTDSPVWCWTTCRQTLCSTKHSTSVFTCTRRFMACQKPCWQRNEEANIRNALGRERKTLIGGWKGSWYVNRRGGVREEGVASPLITVVVFDSGRLWRRRIWWDSLENQHVLAPLLQTHTHHTFPLRLRDQHTPSHTDPQRTWREHSITHQNTGLSYLGIIVQEEFSQYDHSVLIKTGYVNWIIWHSNIQLFINTSLMNMPRKTRANIKIFSEQWLQFTLVWPKLTFL